MRLRLFSIIMLMIMALPAWAFVVDGIEYYTNWDDETTVYVTSKSPKYEGDVVIPASVTYEGKSYRVTSIRNNAFYGCGELTSITIPEGVTFIAGSVFSGCNSLTSINIPAGVTSIESGVFEGCSGLTSINIPGGVISIGAYAFRGCSGLTSIDIPDGVTSIESGVFEGCSGLTSINIPDGVTSIGDWAFGGCNGLTSITIPGGVISIGAYAFRGCSGLTSINIPDGVTSIESCVFEGCGGLTSINIPDGVTSIGEWAFSYCSGLTSINIPAGVTSIESGVFFGCGSLTSITIPEGVTSIEDCAFGNSGLTSIRIPKSATSFEGSVFYQCQLTRVYYGGTISDWLKIKFDESGDSYPLFDGGHLFIDGQEVTEVVIPEDVTSIGNRAFQGLCNLKSVVFHDGVTSIGNSAFYNCFDLTSINIPDGVTSIGKGAFGGCVSIASIVVGEGVASIGDWAFRDCNMISINIPSAVTNIGEFIFYWCDNLKQIVTDNENVDMLKTALGTNYTYVVPCSLYDQYEATGLTTKRADMVKTEAVYATCVAGGNSEYYTCPCGKHYSDEFGVNEIEDGSWMVDALGHAWGDWITTKVATCVETGSKLRFCFHNASHVDVADIAINSNNHTNVVTDEAVAATCTETGLAEGSHCEACHATVVAQTTTDAIGHLFIDYIYNNDATTEKDGTETAECDHNCGATDTHIAEGTKLIQTGVGQVSGDSQRVVKTIENGRVVIIRDGVKYDIMGRKLIEN